MRDGRSNIGRALFRSPPGRDMLKPSRANGALAQTRHHLQQEEMYE